MKKRITNALEYELWNLFSWIGILNHKVKIEGVGCSEFSKEMVLINEKAHYMVNFQLGNLRQIKGLNHLCCLWANKSIKATTDYDNKSIFDFEVDELVKIKPS